MLVSKRVSRRPARDKYRQEIPSSKEDVNLEHPKRVPLLQIAACCQGDEAYFVILISISAALTWAAVIAFTYMCLIS